MTTEWIRWVAAVFTLLVSVGAALSCATTVSNRTGDTLDTSQYPPDIRDAYKVFAVRCSRCHTLARPLNARIRDPQQWVRYVQRMRLNPASGINAKNGEIILRFLLYYMHQREREHGDQDPESELSPTQDNADLQPAAAEQHEQEQAVKPDAPLPPEPTPTADPTLSSPSRDDATEVRMQESQPSLTEAAR
jgi:hypothetical protein